MIVSAERHKEVYNSFRDTDLFSLFMDVLVMWKVEKYFCVSVVFVLGFRHFGLEGWVNKKD